MLTLTLAILALTADTDKLGEPAHAVAIADKLDEPAVLSPLPASFRLPPPRSGPVYEVTLPLYPDAPTRADLKPIGAKLDAVQLALKAMADARRAPPASHGREGRSNPCIEGCACRYPGDCKEAGCQCREAARVAVKTVSAPIRRWYNLTNEPGWQGFGALNAQGQVVVERRRPIAPPRRPVPAAPTFAVPFPAFGPTCTGGRCGR